MHSLSSTPPVYIRRAHQNASGSVVSEQMRFIHHVITYIVPATPCLPCTCMCLLSGLCAVCPVRLVCVVWVLYNVRLVCLVWGLYMYVLFVNVAFLSSYIHVYVHTCTCIASVLCTCISMYHTLCFCYIFTVPYTS